MLQATLPEKATTEEEQCQGSTPKGQCVYAKLPGREYCRLHAGASIVSATEIARTTYLELDQTEYQVQMAKRIAEASLGKGGSNLDDETGTLMMALERILKTCTTDTMLFAKSKEITDMINTLEKLKRTNLVLKKELKELITEDEARKILTMLHTVVVEEVNAYFSKLKSTNGYDLDSKELLENIADSFADTYIKSKQ